MSTKLATGPDHPPAAPSRGRPRSLARRAAVLDAVLLELVEHGLLGMSIEAIAARAGVSKATIYRWWPDKVALTVEALRELPELTEPDTGSLEGDLRELRVGLVELVETTSLGDVLPVLIAERRRSEHSDDISAYITQRSAPFLAIVNRAVARGELPSHVDAALMADLFSSPLANSLLFHDRPLDDGEWRRVIRVVTTGVRAEEVHR